jgi:hypothetical protein
VSSGVDMMSEVEGEYACFGCSEERSGELEAVGDLDWIDGLLARCKM